MRHRFDQLAKQLARVFIEAFGETTSSEEVLADAQQIDIWHVPDTSRDRTPLGLLGRMTEGPSLIEPYHVPPDAEEIRDCIRKHLHFHHLRRTKARSAQPGTVVSLAACWIVSSGRPGLPLQGFGFAPAAGWPAGIYETARELLVKMVVLTELPRTRDTLPLRLLGRGALLRDAIHELVALPPSSWERLAALPILVRLRFEVPEDPHNRTAEEEEIAVTGQEIIEAIETKGLTKGAAPLIHLFERRLKRPLGAEEHARLIGRLDTLGADRVGDVVLDLSTGELAAWLADPDAR